MRALYLAIGVVLAVLVGAGWYWYTHIWQVPTATEQTGMAQDMPVPPLSQSYKNDALRLSFSYPDGYAVREVGGEEGGTILIENPDDSGRGIQISITPFTDTDTAITAERVQEDIPDMVVEDVQPVSLGVAGQGAAFTSDNESFGGDSREVWFVVAGRLYQVSTYAAYDKVLQAIMGTWKFY